ncbi:N-acetyltransferase family protein [Anaerobacillus isosaccharinicus]|uniref:GNAT family N-acetyltransferase n=1 Tax=Anaerobacillus isosaccharinicus TaxID=1532552 RepID=A0A1S2LL92_9BACI|nr:GNAT family N-acetyltransferase [Anaerobacillus isosaccharinicus]MBA5586194.1 GNAT family N-acetyltransferase [Anaerobacillus isosaccharinicus]QOY35544.1 GNAT family N-acetyltransferase [Anaerobacillus isosaccharinicus]
MELKIRKMQAKDIKQVQQVAKISWNTTYNGIIPIEVQENFLSSAYSDEMMQTRLERSFIFVAEVEGDVVGFANFSSVKEGGKVELAAIYLDPQFQGKGIGTGLLEQGIKDIEGIKEIYLNVEKENQSGRTFYKAKGFEVLNEFDDEFDGHILKTVRMILKVS